MKRVLPIVLSILIAAPLAMTLASPADAQVRVGSGAQPRTPPRPRPRLSEAERDRLEAAQDEVAELGEKIAILEESNTAAGGLTEMQRQEWQSHAARRQAAQATVDQLEAKRRS